METVDLPIESPAEKVLEVNEALLDLDEVDPRARQIINLCYFVGLTIPETAHALGVSESTVEHEWRLLRTFPQEALDPKEW